MKIKNTFALGLVVGGIFPLIAYLLTQYTNLLTTFMPEKPLAISVIVAVINLAIFRFSYRAGKEFFAKGVMLATFIAMVVFIYVIKLKV